MRFARTPPHCVISEIYIHKVLWIAFCTHTEEKKEEKTGLKKKPHIFRVKDTF